MNIKMNTKEIEAEVDLLVPTYTCKYIRETAQGTWKCDQWEFEINSVKFDFYTGLGHRGLTEEAKHEIAGEYPLPHLLGSQAYEDYLAAIDAARVPEPPHVAAMLHSLFMDNQSATQSFEDWCEEYGYSSDSRKALEVYLECQEIGRKLRAAVGCNKLAELKTLLEDY